MKAGSGYRPDVDGLRTLAVVPVVLYHAGVAPFTGGYVGVDVFFVISGFLITSILRNDLEAGSYTLRGFYERRARRILPALVACVVATVCAGLLVLPPTDFEALGKSVLSVAVFASNIFFWRDGDYFGREAEEQPLLHTWSLAVEEQFYIVWPLLLALVLWRFPRRWQAVMLLGLIGVSFAVAAWKTGDRSAFFLLHYRAWELGFGAMLGMGFVPEVRSRAARQALSGLGALMILVPVFAYTRETPFPGYTALPPCLGAALLLHANRSADTLTAGLLSLKPVVAIGLISYSLYLWHWPILVLSRIWLNRPLTPAETLVALGASLAMAWASWRFVEAPFRKPDALGLGNFKMLAGSAVALAAVGSVGQAAVVTRGAEWRASPSVRKAEQAAGSINPLRERCHTRETGVTPGPQADCTTAPGRYQVLLWGDSHADHFAPVVRRWAAEHGMAARQASKSACRPLLTDDPAPEVGVAVECVRFNANVLAEAEATPSMRVIILSALWVAGRGALEPRLSTTLAELRARFGPNVRIVVLGSTPTMGFWTTQCLSRARYNRADEATCRSGVALNAKGATLSDALIRKAVARTPGVTFVSLWDQVCRGAKCRTAHGDTVLMRDHNHFTVEGAELVLRPALETAAVGEPMRIALR
jgi:peptidoglycan/LPS O-acetylase OafA/YrhL